MTFSQNRAHAYSHNFNLGRVKRKHDRVAITGLTGELVDGSSVVGVIVDDISLGGFKVTQVPQNISLDQHSYRAVISKNGKHYKMLIKPCWESQPVQPGDKEIGFKILDSCYQWASFLKSQQNQQESDIRKSILA